MKKIKIPQIVLNCMYCTVLNLTPFHKLIDGTMHTLSPFSFAWQPSERFNGVHSRLHLANDLTIWQHPAE